MDKPITMLIEEFEQNLVKVVNESKLPPFIVERCLRDIYHQTLAQASEIAKREREQYEKEKDTNE